MKTLLFSLLLISVALCSQSKGGAKLFRAPKTEASAGLLETIYEKRANSKETRIVGGNRVPNPNPYPWMVFYGVQCGLNGDSGLCGGSLIQDDVVLTAAHCFAPCDDVYIIEVMVGRDIFDPDETRESAFIVLHAGFTFETLENDIALIFLNNRFRSVEKMPRIATRSISSNQVVTATGWGAQFEGDGVTDILREVELLTQPDRDCTDIFGDFYVTETQLCAGLPGFDTCQGDSGGPLFTIDDCCDFPGVTIYGITSYGNGCAVVDAAYTQVEEYLDWMELAYEVADFNENYNEDTCCECDGANDVGDVVPCDSDDGDNNNDDDDDFFDDFDASASLLASISLVLGSLFWAMF